ncbi:MAG: hypothetical protein H0U98_15155 [Alphaproteobacteria bacterium]|nr:hypothetical protein [Alphaproteobacteria bacterium]
MNRKGLIALCLLAGGCAGEAVRTPDQARTIALPSSCAKLRPVLAPHETPSNQWLAERRGDKWYAWLPYGLGARLPGGMGPLSSAYGHFGAWISPRDGTVLYCERGGEEAADTTTITLPTLPKS